jgi:hypothetical protein
MVVAGTNMPSAALFLLGVGPLVLTVPLAVDAASPVPVAWAAMDWEDVWFSKRIWGLLVAVGNVELVVFVLVEEVDENEWLEDEDELDELLLLLLLLVLLLLLDEDELEVEDVEVELEVELELVEVEVGVGVGVVDVVGVGVGVGLGVELGVGVGDGLCLLLELDLAEPEPPEELPALKTTMFAVWPLGTVTTQKLAPPAPVA